MSARLACAAALLAMGVVASSRPVVAGAVSSPVVTPWGANSFRVQWAAPGYTVADELPFTPFLDAPVSVSAVSSDGVRTTNGNLAIDVVAGLVTATRVSDSAVVFRSTALAFAAAALPGIPPSAQLTFDGPAQSETLVGFGEQGLTGRVTAQFPFQRSFADTEFYAYNQGRQAFFPLYFSSAGYGLMFALPSYGWLNVDHQSADGAAINSSSVRVFDMWITTTATTPVFSAGAPHPFLGLLTQYFDAVGHAPLMPAFASGFIASKDRYHNQSQFLSVAHGYIDRDIPLSLLTIDWFHWNALGDMSLKSECWPDPTGMIDELRTLGIETMITHWPFMATNSVHRAEYEKAGALAINSTSGTADTFWEYLQSGSLIMAFSEGARNRTFGHWYDGYGVHGARAVWLDETEPDRDSYSYGQWTYEGYSDLEVGPSWKYQWLKTMTDGLRAVNGVGNYFLLSRSAWMGTPKMGHAVWSGDTDSDWDTLALQIPTGLGAGLSVRKPVRSAMHAHRFPDRWPSCSPSPPSFLQGIGLWTHDIGGYNPTMQPLDPKLQELLVRWFQFGSVSPLMRLHGHRNGGPASDPVCMQTNGDNEPWTLVDPGVNYDSIVASIRFREQLRNYVMDTQAAWAATGAPMIAPIWLLFPGDAVCAFTSNGDEPACGAEFMFGQDWLAKPVTAYLQREAWVYLPLLPVGQSWTYHFNGTSFGQGGVNVTIATPVSEFPLFYRKRFPPQGLETA